MATVSHHGQSIGVGQMRHRVRVEKRSTAQDSAGEPVLSWVLVADRPAALRRTPGDEVFAAAGRNMRVPVVFHMRYEQSVFDVLQQSEVRVLFNAKFHDVISVVDEDGVKTWMTVSCQQRVESPP